jgi:hypothetical protein
MAENKKSFISYCDWGETFDELDDAQAGKLVKHLFNYVRDRKPESDQITKLLFIPIKQTLKRDLTKYKTYVEKQRENGSKGGRPKNPKKPKEPTGYSGNPTEPKKADSVSDSVNVNDSVIDSISFEIFWNLYDKKVGNKSKLVKKWDKLKEGTQLQILKHVELYIQSTQEKRFRKNPETYFNNESWNDEIIEVNNGTHQQINGGFSEEGLRDLSESIANDDRYT